MQIIKGKTIPLNKTGKWNRIKKYPYENLEISDCFFVPCKKAGYSAAAAARNWGLKHGRKFIARQEGGGIYIWRVS